LNPHFVEKLKARSDAAERAPTRRPAAKAALRKKK
jgi:hypothetical protein